MSSCIIFTFLFTTIPIIIFKTKNVISSSSKKNNIIITIIWSLFSFLISYLILAKTINSNINFVIELITVMVSSIYVYNILMNNIDNKNFVKLLIVFILFMCSSIFSNIPILLFNIDINNISQIKNTWLTVFDDFCLLLMFIMIFFKNIKQDFKDFIKNFNNYMDTSIKYWFIGLTIMIISNIILLILSKAQAVNEQSVQAMIKVAPIASFISAGILAPIIEEITFRKSFYDAFKNKYLFILSSGLIFGGLHVIFSATTLLQFLYIIPYSSLGIAFAAIAYKTKNMYPSIVMHLLHNIFLIILSLISIALVVI